MFTTIKNLIPEPRQANQPRGYVGRHRQPDNAAPAAATAPPAKPADAPEEAEPARA